jgi:hypothetical protein
MSNAKFDRMIRYPSSEQLVLFAGQRIRSAELLIETVDRKFIAQGGTWSPSSLLMTQIEKVALGQLTCPSL